MPGPSGSSEAAPSSHAGRSDSGEQEAARLAAAGADLAAEGQCGAAAALFQRALALGPPPTDAAVLQEMLAQCRMAEGEDEGAYEAAAAAVHLRPGWPAALLTLGRAARNAGRLREAAAALESCLQSAAAEQAAGRQGAAPGCSATGPTTEPALAEGATAPDCGARAAAAAAAAAAGAAAAARVEAGKDREGPDEEGLDDEEAAAARQELAEVRSLLQLQLGHQLGLPGLRVLEQHGGATGPGSVVWEAGALLAWLLVQQGRGGEAGGGSDPCTCEQPAGDASRGAACGRTAECAQPTMQCRVHDAGPRASGGRGLGAPAPLAGSVVRGARVLELGSGGTGLVGIAAACLGAHVVATDLPEVLPQLQAAAALNAGMIAAASGSLRCAACDWAAPPAALLAPPGGPSDQYAWLVGADLVYSLPQVQPLVDTVAAAAAAAAAAGAPPLRLLIAHKRRHEEVDAALLGGLRGAGLALQAVLRDPGSRCTVYASEAAAEALRAAQSSAAG